MRSVSCQRKVCDYFFPDFLFFVQISQKHNSFENFSVRGPLHSTPDPLSAFNSETKPNCVAGVTRRRDSRTPCVSIDPCKAALYLRRHKGQQAKLGSYIITQAGYLWDETLWKTFLCLILRVFYLLWNGAVDSESPSQKPAATLHLRAHQSIVRVLCVSVTSVYISCATRIKNRTGAQHNVDTRGF
jgi:hypothetical protein